MPSIPHSVFWVESPNGLPDPDPSNNYACDGALLATHTDDPFANGKVKIYPNPGDDQVVIDLEESQAGKWKCYLTSVDGRKLLQLSLDKNVNMISVANFPAGIYLLKLADEQGRSLSRKLCVQH